MDGAFDLARIGAGLPVAQTIGTLPELLKDKQTLVVEAPPGTGKTTLVPPALANQVEGKVLVVAPRRVAVRAAARRLAQLDGTKIGDRVGYTIRGEHHPGSRVEFVTPGVLVRRLLSDPALEGIDAVAIDEIHERQLDTDLVFGMLLDLVQLREDLVVAAMSATLDAQAFAGLMGARVMSTPAVTHPLDVRYQPHPGRAERTPEFYAALADAATRAVHETGHSALVFVPGVREVDAVLGHLTRDGNIPALPLHGRLDSRAQDAALTPAATPRIVVATSIAESSLTVPGVRAVIDSGLSRVPRRDTRRGMTGLVTLTAAQSTMDQRAGRAGREGPGTVIRMLSTSDFEHAPVHITPEIATTDLTQAALWFAAWGTPRGEGLVLPDAPPTAALDDAEMILRRLGAIATDGSLTARGDALVGLPLDPRLGRALIECGPAAAPVIAKLSSVGGARADRGALRRETTRLEKLAARVADKSSPYYGTADAGVITGLAFPDRIARREGDDYLLASGTRAFLPADIPGVQGAEWIAVAEATRSRARAGRAGSTIRQAARIDERAALDIIGVEKETTASFDGGKLRGRAVRRAGAIELSTTPVKVPPDTAAAALAAHIRAHGLGMFRFSAKAAALKDRLDFLRSQLGSPWPDVESADPEWWLGPELDAMAHGTPPEKVDMYPALQRLLPWPEANQLDELAPARLPVPSGSHPRVDYSAGRPVVRVKLQECFGMGASPSAAGVPIQFHLLSPAGRPLAVTDDLESFWSGAYAQVRADMRGRYPKHPWPEDPWNAPATPRTKKRM